MKRLIVYSVVGLSLLGGCPKPKTESAPKKSAAKIKEQQEAARSAVSLLQSGRFEEAATSAQEALGEDDQNPQARVVAAVSRYIQLSHQLYTDFASIGGGLLASGEVNDQYVRFTAQNALRELELVSADLEVAARSPEVYIELCMACWERDWNRSGEVDSRDRALLQIELDQNGEYLPEDDPRRSPTFRFDHGDVYWGLAMVNFQRAFFHLMLAYRWSDIKLNAWFSGELPEEIVIHLADASQVSRAKELFLAGLSASTKERAAYLAETDDDREFLPNPKQKNYAIPLPVDEALYQTWGRILGDLERLIKGEEGLDVAQAAQLGDDSWDNPPKGFINIGRLFSKPGDLTINLEALDDAEKRPEAALQSVFGEAYVPTMRPSPITARIAQMSAEIERGEDSFEKKLRYFLWVN